MKCSNKIISLVCWATSLLLTAACHDDPTPTPDKASPTFIHVATKPMRIVGEQVPFAHTRADQPLPPEYENSIYTLTTLVFDAQEGVLRHFNLPDNQRKLYKFTNLQDANGNGLLTTTLSTEGFPVSEGNQYIVCLIANLSEKEVEEMIQSMMDDGTVFFDEFKNYEIPIPYVKTPGEGEEAELEAGHVRKIYMFGYYQGYVKEHTDIDISLGRIIARVEITFSFDANKPTPGKSLFIRLRNLEQTAHLFPTGKSPKKLQTISTYKVPLLGDLNNNTIFLYAAPSSASNEDESLCLDMWYEDDNLNPTEVDKKKTTASVCLCNDQPGVDNRNFQLNRNSTYRFNLNLK